LGVNEEEEEKINLRAAPQVSQYGILNPEPETMYLNPEPEETERGTLTRRNAAHQVAEAIMANGTLTHYDRPSVESL